MFKRTCRFFEQHLSLLVIMVGAISFFVSNLVMKEILSAAQYGHYSIFVTYFSLIYVFGILGTEQVFLRFSMGIKKNTIETQKFQLILIASIILLSSICSCYLFKQHYAEIEINTILLFVSSLGMIGILFSFSVLRLNTNFVLAQFITNYWKMCLFILAVLFYIFKNADFELFIKIICFNIFFVFVLSAIYIYKKMTFLFNDTISNKEIVRTSFHFFLSILSFSLLIFADRFIIEKKYSFEEFGNFFYLTNFFLAPYTILQNYIGFKQLIVFKNEFNAKYLANFNRKIILLGSLLGLCLFLSALLLSFTETVAFKFNKYIPIIGLLLFTGILRLYSSSIISAFEARTNIQTLRKANIYIVSITVFILCIAVFTAGSIEAILMYVIVIWFLRCFVHKKLLFHQMKNTI